MEKPNYVVKLDLLLADESYARHNMASRPYHENVIRQWLKNQWEYVESSSERDEELRAIWIDLNSAIESLPELERMVTRAYAEGYRSGALIEFTGRPDSTKILARGIKGMVLYLRGERTTE